jgi:DNA repair protein RecO (recombination protein O)
VIQDKTVGLVIRSVDFSETSKVVTLFTRDLGKVAAMAKGARRLKGSFEVSLELLSVCGIGLLRKPSAELDLLTESSLVERFAGLRLSLPAYYAACYVAELLDGFLQKDDPHATLFDDTLTILRRLGPDGDVTLLTLRFVARLLGETGLAPRLEDCTVCGLDAPSGPRPALSLRTGGRVCDSCQRGVPDAQEVSKEAFRTLGALLFGDAATADGLSPTPAARRELVRTMTRTVEYHLGRKPRTAELLMLR